MTHGGDSRAMASRAPVALILVVGCASPSDDDTPAMTGIGSVGDTANGSTGTTAAMPGDGTVASTADTTDPSSDGSGGGPVFDLGDATATGVDCTPVSADEQTCDDIDDDCNGFVDDIDAAGDGICDCLEIALFGQPGSLASSQFVMWLNLQGTSTERIDPAVVDAQTLAAYDVIIIDQLSRAYAPAEAAAFSDWVEGGGGLMAMTGHTADPTSAQTWPNGLLAAFELAYAGPLLNGPVTDFPPHPIGAGLTSVTFAGGFAVTETNAGVSDVVGQLPEGPVARARSFGDGKVFVWGDEWIEYDSEWSSMPEITQLWVNALDWLRPADLCAPPPG